jgi:hypothetical protein
LRCWTPLTKARSRESLRRRRSASYSGDADHVVARFEH